MSLNSVINSLHNSFRQLSGAEGSSLVILKKKSVGYAELLTMTSGWITFNKTDKEKNLRILYLQFTAPAESMPLIIKGSGVVFFNLNPFTDGQIYQMLKDAVLPQAGGLWTIPLTATGEKYPS